MLIRLLLIVCTSFATVGCAGSRWARSDAKYARKYAKHSDNVLQMAKQSMDARFLRGRQGHYFSAGGGTEPATAHAELGMMLMPTSWSETRMGLIGVLGTPNENLYGGANAGVRLQSPTRLAPFVGAGVFAGKEPWGWDDDDSLIPDRQDDKPDFAVALYPEAGLHWWMTPNYRITTSASYYAGWSYEPWMFSITFARVPGRPAPPPMDWENWLTELNSTEHPIEMSAMDSMETGK